MGGIKINCSTEILQTYLDDELNQEEKEKVQGHLGSCPACRRELSRLRLLWLELDQDDNMEIPYELPFIRQQAISRAKAIIDEAKGDLTSGISLWDAQKLAWRPALTGFSQIPGTRQLGRLAKTTGRELPAVIRGASALLGRFTGRRRGQS